MRLFPLLGALALLLLIGSIAAAAPITFSGSNDYVTPDLPLNPGRLNVEWSCGDGYFSIWLVDANGENVDLIASQIDSASGSTVTHIENPGNYVLKVSADSPWTIALPVELQTTTATTFSGSNDKVTPALSLTAGRLNVDWSCGKGYFSIWLVDANGENVDLIASQIDSASGSTVTRIPNPGYYMLKVSADSPWTIALPNLQPIQTPAPVPIVTNPEAPAPVVVTTTPAPVYVPPTLAPVYVPPTVAPVTTVVTLQPFSQPVVQPVVTLNPSSGWGKRYAVGDPGTYLGTRAGSSTAPTGTSRRVAATTGTVLKPGSKSYGVTPPASGSFVRWYPAARWAAGIK